jgi:PAS domain S-box-containing protein
LRHSEQRRIPVPDASLYKLLIEHVRDYAIFALDAHGYVMTWNRGAERLKGYAPKEIIGKHFSTFYPEDALAEGKPETELAVAIAEGRVEDEGWRIRKDGTRFWANVVITALFDKNNELVGFAKVTRDLTERRAAEQQSLLDATRLAEAQAANKTKSEFLAAMSHELRTPLNAIGGYADLLKLGIRGTMNEQQLEDIERIIASQRHLLGIINDLLNFSRIEAGKLQYASESVDLKGVTDRVMQMVQPLAIAKGVELRAHPPRGDIVAQGDTAKVEQVLINLASNAVNYTPAGGWLEIDLGTEEDRVFISVEDSGVGIPKEKLETIFEPFVQVGRNLSTSHHGTGLGLTISRDLAVGMGGELTVESTVGEGSQFVLWLPPADPGAGRKKSAKVKP